MKEKKTKISERDFLTLMAIAERDPTRQSPAEASGLSDQNLLAFEDRMNHAAAVAKAGRKEKELLPRGRASITFSYKEMCALLVRGDSVDWDWDEDIHTAPSKHGRYVTAEDEEPVYEVHGTDNKRSVRALRKIRKAIKCMRASVNIQASEYELERLARRKATEPGGDVYQEMGIDPVAMFSFKELGLIAAAFRDKTDAATIAVASSVDDDQVREWRAINKKARLSICQYGTDRASQDDTAYQEEDHA